MPLYDIVLAPPDAAQRLAALEAPLSTHPGFSCRPIDHVKLATLMAQLGLGSVKDAIQQLDPSAEASEDGPWVTQLPPSLLSLVLALAPSAREHAAAQWGGTEEFRRDRIGPAEARQFLAALASLAQQAAARDASVFLWSSL